MSCGKDQLCMPLLLPSSTEWLLRLPWRDSVLSAHRPPQTRNDKPRISPRMLWCYHFLCCLWRSLTKGSNESKLPTELHETSCLSKPNFYSIDFRELNWFLLVTHEPASALSQHQKESHWVWLKSWFVQGSLGCHGNRMMQNDAFYYNNSLGYSPHKD